MDQIETAVGKLREKGPDPHRIMVVEDDDSIRRILRYQLEAAGYEVIEASNGLMALELLNQDEPDLVLLDFMMPDMDGHTVCKKIREQRRHHDLPVIFLTAKSDAESKIVSLGDGANDYLTKPYDANELLLRIRNLIGWGQAQRDRNPLTGLPGNPAIEADLQARLKADQLFAFLYIDLDHFKAYNDTYSYRAGDDVIRLMADVLIKAVDSYGNEDDFIGHIGGDDFVVITSPERTELMCQQIVNDFDERILDFYRPAERDRGFVEVENRRHEKERFPLVSTTIALVESDRYQITHVAMLNDIVAELKRLGKMQSGSVVVRDQRFGNTDSAIIEKPAPRTGSDG